MKKQTTKKAGSKTAQATAISAGIAGLAATAYFFLGPDGKKNQKAVKSWAIKMKGDVVEKLENAREVGEPVYHQIIDTVAAKYEKGKTTAPAEVQALAKDLKKHWKTISAAIVVKKPKAKTTAKKATKKTVAKKPVRPVAKKKVTKK